MDKGATVTGEPLHVNIPVCPLRRSAFLSASLSVKQKTPSIKLVENGMIDHILHIIIDTLNTVRST